LRGSESDVRHDIAAEGVFLEGAADLVEEANEHRVGAEPLLLQVFHRGLIGKVLKSVLGLSHLLVEAIAPLLLKLLELGLLRGLLLLLGCRVLSGLLFRKPRKKLLHLAWEDV